MGGKTSSGRAGELEAASDALDVSAIAQFGRAYYPDALRIVAGVGVAFVVVRHVDVSIIAPRTPGHCTL